MLLEYLFFGFHGHATTVTDLWPIREMLGNNYYGLERTLVFPAKHSIIGRSDTTHGISNLLRRKAVDQRTLDDGWYPEPRNFVL